MQLTNALGHTDKVVHIKTAMHSRNHQNEYKLYRDSLRCKDRGRPLPTAPASVHVDLGKRPT